MATTPTTHITPPIPLSSQIPSEKREKKRKGKK
jgi:hypothetical protein